MTSGSPLHAFTSAGWEYADTAAAAKFWESGQVVAEKLGVKSSDTHLLVNGRVGPALDVALHVLMTSSWDP